MKDFWKSAIHYLVRCGLSEEQVEQMEPILVLEQIERTAFSDSDMFVLSALFGDWMKKNIVSAQTLEKYFETFNIDDDGLAKARIWASFNVERSETVRLGYNIKDSYNVDDSTDVTDSEMVSLSNEVVKSSFIINSTNVSRSDYIACSIDVKGSTFVTNSTDITTGSYLYNCHKVKEAIGAIECSDSSQIFFSLNLRNCNHCLLCNKLSNSDFFIFNQPVEPRLWFVMTELVKEKMRKEKLGVSTEFIPTDNWHGFITKETSGVFSNAHELYRYLSDDAVKYLLSIPDVKRDFLYNLTRNDKFLTLGQN